MNTPAASGVIVRVCAARALDRIVRGTSLRFSFAHYSGLLADARDRALLSSLLHEGARWWLRFDAALNLLLERALPEREGQIRALAVLGIVQLEILQLPEYAAVAATVDAVRALGKPKFAALVNAVLRRWLRERSALMGQLDANDVTRSAHPRWLIDMVHADWPARASAILAANNAQAPLWLRVNRRRTTRAALLERFAAAGLVAEEVDGLDCAIRLERSLDVTTLPGYVQGLFSVQDGAAQFAARLLDLRDGQRVLDACAAPGGKTAHVLESADVRMVALDADAARLPRLRENLARLGLQCEVRAGDAATPDAWWDGQVFDRILIDAPCSASGIVRRQPDIKLHRRGDDIPALIAAQQRILDALWPLLVPGGRLVYATCSVLIDENMRALAGFTMQHADAKPAAVALPGWHEVGAGALQNLPGDGGMDGFFYAIVEKGN